MPRPRTLLVLLVLLALTLTLVDTRGPETGPLSVLRRGADAVLGPPQRLVSAAVRGTGDGLARLGGEPPQTAAQRDELGRLRGQVVELRSELALQEQLRSLLGQRDSSSLTLVTARVIGRAAFQPFASTVVLDAGGRDGIATGMAVVTGAGLAGKVVRVSRTTASVVLLDDPAFSVGVQLAGEDGGGIGFATGDGDALDVRLLYGTPTQGAAAVTAGSDTFAAGVPVGRVTGVVRAGAGQPGTATLSPFVDLGRLDLVGVVLDGPRTLPRPATTPVTPAAPTTPTQPPS